MKDKLPVGWLKLVINRRLSGEQGEDLFLPRTSLLGVRGRRSGGCDLWLPGNSIVFVQEGAENILAQVAAQDPRPPRDEPPVDNVAAEDDADDGAAEDDADDGHTEAHFLTLFVWDGQHETMAPFVNAIENRRYPNHCMMPDVLYVQRGELMNASFCLLYVLVIDHDQLGGAQTRDILQAHQPKGKEGAVYLVNTVDLGVWYDQHPLNMIRQRHDEFCRLFDVDPTHLEKP